MKPARLLELGRRGYREVLELQREVHARVAAGQAPDTWIVVEHEAVVTLGRNAKGGEHLKVSRERLGTLGVDCVEVERGGDVTYHGPGQVVVYPIARLERFREIVPLVSALERAVIAAVGSFGIEAHGREEHRGVYVGRNSIAAVGLAVQRMTSLHGVALNVCNTLHYDRLITPCGMAEFGVTSISNEIGHAVLWSDGRAALLKALAEEFDMAFEREGVTA